MKDILKLQTQQELLRILKTKSLTELKTFTDKDLMELAESLYQMDDKVDAFETLGIDKDNISVKDYFDWIKEIFNLVLDKS